MPAARTTLDYRTAPVAGRYEWAMESERARMLRRRFLWFTATMLGLSLLTAPLTFWGLFADPGATRWDDVINVANFVVQVAVLVWAFWYARRRLRGERRIFGLAFWIVVGLGLLSLFAGRLSVEFLARDPDTTEFRAGFEAGYRGAGGESARTTAAGVPIEIGIDPPVVTPAAVPGIPAPPVAGGGAPGVRMVRSILSLAVLAVVVLMSHLPACLFLPWKAREAMRPAAWLLAGCLAVVLLDVATGWARWPYALAACIIVPPTVVPGTLWCWWRHSAFRQRYRLAFVSDQFRQIENDLAGARRVHDSVLPPPRTDGAVRVAYAYEPARQIGGDLVFVHPRLADPDRPDQPVSVVVLDVAGHGIAAALAVNRLAGELERLFAEHPDLRPDRLMAMLNRYVHLTLARHSAFVTGFAVRVDPAAKRPLSVCGAGHPDAFLCAGGQVKRLASESIMLGVVPPEAFEAATVEYDFAPGDALVLYTDGAAEARNGDGRMVTIDGVCTYAADALRHGGEPRDWPGAMLRRVAAYRNAPPEDDTLVAVVYRAGTGDW